MSIHEKGVKLHNLADIFFLFFFQFRGVKQTKKKNTQKNVFEFVAIKVQI